MPMSIKKSCRAAGLRVGLGGFPSVTFGGTSLPGAIEVTLDHPLASRGTPDKSSRVETANKGLLQSVYGAPAWLSQLSV